MIDGHRICVAIPMRDGWEMSNALMIALLDDHDFDHAWIFDNGSTDSGSRRWIDSVVSAKWEDVTVLSRPASSIYQMWNEAWRMALEVPGTYLGILNNDITTPPNLLGHLATALHAADEDVWITYPEWQRPTSAGLALDGTITKTHGTRNAGGMSGYCFMLDADCRHRGVPPIDEQFEWHSGDGDLIQQVQLLDGFAARVNGLPLDHVGGATAKTQAWVGHAKRRDATRRRSKYGG